MEAELQRDPVAGIFLVEGLPVGLVGARLEDGAVLLVFDAHGMAHEQIVVHADHRAPGRTFGDQRQAEARQVVLLHRPARPLGH
ncbi:hypothetical protein D3C72_2215900 [compost metagenome]